MMATRPREEGAAAAAASSSQEEKSIPGVSRDALKEERTPLLDLDDVEQLESELAAFDAPPPPPLNIRREEPAATVSSWTPAAEPRYVETYVAPPTPAAVAAAQARGELPQVRQQEQQQEQQGTRVSDFSSLYSATPHRAESVGQLYPALVPSAPSPDAMRAPMPRSAAAASSSSRTVPHGGAAVAVAAAAAAAAAASSSSTAVEAARAAREGFGDVATSGEVVEELLSENERLRLIIQDMSEELERVSVQARGGAAAASSGATQGQSAPATTSATPVQRLLGQYPGAAAEAARRQREQQSAQQQQQPQRQRQSQPQSQEQQAQPPTLQNTRPGTFVHFKCENCPQWLKCPGHAQLIYCPVCGHTSQMTANSTIHIPPNNEMPNSGASGAGAGGRAAAGRGQEEEVGWIGYFKSILAS